MMRLQKYLSLCGVSSRRKGEELITNNRVKVNDKVINVLGFKVNESDIVKVDNVIVNPEQKEYYLLYKPEKIICSVKDEKNRKTVIDLIDTKCSIFPIGRLDYDTSGVLLLTNDGELCNKLLHPSKDIEKTYYAKIDGILTNKEKSLIDCGVIIDGIKTKKAKVRIKKIDKKNNKSYIEITITEGRNHEVKNIFELFNHKVLKLKRIQFSFLTLDEMKKGEYRKLTVKEVKQLYNIVKQN